MHYVHVVQVAGVLTQYDAMVEMQEEEADKSSALICLFFYNLVAPSLKYFVILTKQLLKQG